MQAIPILMKPLSDYLYFKTVESAYTATRFCLDRFYHTDLAVQNDILTIMIKRYKIFK
jgi:hypothetical protein